MRATIYTRNGQYGGPPGMGHNCDTHVVADVKKGGVTYPGGRCVCLEKNTGGSETWWNIERVTLDPEVQDEQL